MSITIFKLFAPGPHLYLSLLHRLNAGFMSVGPCVCMQSQRGEQVQWFSLGSAALIQAEEEKYFERDEVRPFVDFLFSLPPTTDAHKQALTRASPFKSAHVISFCCPIKNITGRIFIRGGGEAAITRTSAAGRVLGAEVTNFSCVALNKFAHKKLFFFRLSWQQAVAAIVAEYRHGMRNDGNYLGGHDKTSDVLR